MTCVPKNHFPRPEKLSVAVDTQRISDRFSCHERYNAIIKVCAVCSITDVMVGEESKQLPLEHKNIQLLNGTTRIYLLIDTVWPVSN